MSDESAETPDSVESVPVESVPVVSATVTSPRAVLVGPPGAGKSTIGRRLANALGVDVHDTDVAIERRTGRTIPEIFGEDGEPAFRAIEEDVVLAALSSQTGVVSLGGGAVLSQRTRDALQGHTVIYLEISVGEGLRRTGTHTSRPLLVGDPRAKYRELMRRRRPLYRSVATIRVRTDGRSPSRVVAQIMTKMGLEPPPPGPRPRERSQPVPKQPAAQQTTSKSTRSRRSPKPSPPTAQERRQ